ncbi:hypothetical protein [Pseudooceanicola antarcticus]|uniref:GIY-YIG domain-containing protein n=1 Tax=Pseudooceanicola antarcticus TaxID=1247613 RepID=A0ABX4MI74_9RHOB|nr:hypothetical protein [Pseudooceanicola antarcticus]PJE25726.1 hypothetical protein CVM39_18625 [Pseudooceanicola antarcticus]
MLRWSEPRLLADYLALPKGPGIYVIGHASDPVRKVQAGQEIDAYLYNWPENFTSLYVGISESRREGVRGRLRSHFRARGNADLAARQKRGEVLWYIAALGTFASHEALFLALANGFFPSNLRDEGKRFAIRLNREIDAQIAAEEAARKR